MKHTVLKSSLVVCCLVITIAGTNSATFFKPQQAIAATNTCNSVLSPLPQAITDAVNANLPFYKNAEAATGAPWELLAAIHYRETNFSHSNPANGQGIFQFVNGDGGPYPPGPVSDSNFQQQLNYMASRVQSDYVFRGSLAYVHRALKPNEPDDFRVQDTLYSYNGRSSAYAQQGVQYGFNATTQPYEGSPYVMNMFDCARSNMGIITQDYGSIDGIDTRYGAFTLYARLKGDPYWQSRYDWLGTNLKLNLPGCNEATNTTIACVWRLHQISTGAQALAGSIEQRDQLIAYGYKLDTTQFFGNVPIAPQPGNIPVYALLDPGYSTFITTDANERDALVNSYGYTDMGISFYADPPGSNAGFPVWRLYSASLGRHMWVSDPTERQQLLGSGYADEGQVFNSIDTVRQETPAPKGKQLVYRFYIPATYSHFWTTDLVERDNMIKAGYSYEGVAWYSLADTSGTPVYRLYAPSLRQHLYTTDASEKDRLVASQGWNYEGISEYVSGDGTKPPVYRLYAPSLGVHLYTTDAYERSVLLGSGKWNNENVAWYQP